MNIDTLIAEREIYRQLVRFARAISNSYVSDMHLAKDESGISSSGHSVITQIPGSDATAIGCCIRG